MEVEELEYLEYERSLSSTDSAASADEKLPSPAAGTLEDRLREMRLAKSEGAQRKSHGAAVAQRDAKPASATASALPGVSETLLSAAAVGPQSCPPIAPRDKVCDLSSLLCFHPSRQLTLRADDVAALDQREQGGIPGGRQSFVDEAWARVPIACALAAADQPPTISRSDCEPHQVPRCGMLSP